MSELAADPQRLDQKLLDDEYFAGGGYALRWAFYDYSQDETGQKVDFHDNVTKRLNLAGTETVLDIGCGQGGFFMQLREDGHSGHFVGMDTNRALGMLSTDELTSWVVASASCHPGENGEPGRYLPFADDSVDLASAQFMLYHVEAPAQTIHEAVRVVKPDGKVAITTSGSNNKPQHQRYYQMIADYAGAIKPPSYTAPFTIEVADQLLPEIFDDIEVWEPTLTVTIDQQDLTNHYRGEDTVVRALINSLKSNAMQYKPRQEGYINAPIQHVVLPDIQRQIDENGVFVEEIRRKLYICRQPKI